jgi:pimeloyl-ACP methyl ester carboxylesterase
MLPRLPEIDKFFMLGRSGGSAHALAHAAKIPDRATRAVALVSLAPFDAERLNWFACMSDSNIREYANAESARKMLTHRLADAAARIRADPLSHVAVISPDMPPSDRRVMTDAGIRVRLAESFGQALRDSAGGWIDDALAFTSPWGFEVSEIKGPCCSGAGLQILSRRLPTPTGLRR